MAEQEQAELMESAETEAGAVEVMVPEEGTQQAVARKNAAQVALERAEAFVVETDEDAEQATELVREYRESEQEAGDLLEPFIRPLREVLDRLYELRRGAQKPLKKAQKVLRGKVKEYHREKEAEARRRAEAERKRQEEEARKRREQAALEAAEEDDEERFEAISRNMDEPTAPPEPPAETKPKQPEKTHYVDNWKAELAGDSDEARRESLQALAKAAAAGNTMALQVLALDDKRAKELAKATSGQLELPGVRMWNDRTLVVR